MLLAVDVSFRNFGWSLWHQRSLVDIGIIQTEKCHDRNMYAFAQDAVEVAGAFRQFSSLIDARGVQALLVELPHGSQSAAAAKSAGYAVGIMGCLSACHDLPMDFVTPQRVKKLASGSASATKRQMIDRACELAPIKIDLRGRLSVYSFNMCTVPEGRFEHVADSICLYHAAAESNILKIYG